MNLQMITPENMFYLWSIQGEIHLTNFTFMNVVSSVDNECNFIWVFGETDLYFNSLIIYNINGYMNIMKLSTVNMLAGNPMKIELENSVF